MAHEILLFGFGGPTEWIVILAVIMLLFGGSKLPQLAKALGQSKRAFKEGMDEAEEAEALDRARPTLTAGQTTRSSALSAVDDEALFEEARRRAAALRATDNPAVKREADNTTPGQMR